MTRFEYSLRSLFAGAVDRLASITREVLAPDVTETTDRLAAMEHESARLANDIARREALYATLLAESKRQVDLALQLAATASRQAAAALEQLEPPKAQQDARTPSEIAAFNERAS